MVGPVRRLGSWLARRAATASRRLTWQALERLCLVVGLGAKVWWLKRRWGELYGADAQDEIDVSNLLSLHHINLRLRECFNCYQPPLGFLLGKAPRVFGLSEINAWIVSSLAAYFAAFFFLRATLRYLGLLARPAAITFLYLTLAIPVSSYLAYAINLDSYMYAWGAGILYASVRVFWVARLPPVRVRWRPFWAVVLVGLLATVPLIKISGFTLCSIPVAVAVVQGRPGWRGRVARSLLPGVLAVALVSPYFYLRFYKQTGHFLVMNHEWRFKEEIEAGRAWRREHPVRFWIEMLKPNPGAEQDPNLVDFERVRLDDWWRFYWLRPEFMGFPGESQYRVSRTYLAVMPWLLLAGAAAFLRRWRVGTLWRRLGWVLVLEGAIQLASMVRYFYLYPDAIHIPGKPQYISPVLWTLCFLFAGLATSRYLFPQWLAQRWKLGRQVLIVAVVLWGIYNDAIGIY